MSVPVSVSVCGERERDWSCFFCFNLPTKRLSSVHLTNKPYVPTYFSYHMYYSDYLSSSSESKLKFAVENELITKHAKVLVEMENSGCEYMMNESKISDLALMYSLYSRVPSTLDFLREFLFEHVKQLGMQIIADQQSLKDPVAFVQKVLYLKSKYDIVVTNSFRADKKAQKRLKDAFDEFLNKDRSESVV